MLDQLLLDHAAYRLFQQEQQAQDAEDGLHQKYFAIYIVRGYFR